MVGLPAPGVLPRQSPIRATLQPTTVTAAEVGGIAVASLPAPPSGFVGMVTYVSLQTTSTTAATCTLQIDGWPVDYASQVSGAATEYRGLYIPTGQTLDFVFSGLSAGSTAGARAVWAMMPDIDAVAFLGGR